MHRIEDAGYCYRLSSVVRGLCVCVSVCLLVTFVSPAKAAEPIEMPFGADSCGPRKLFIRCGQCRTNPFAAARGDRTAIRPFVKCLWQLVGKS